MMRQNTLKNSEASNTAPDPLLIEENRVVPIHKETLPYSTDVKENTYNLDIDIKTSNDQEHKILSYTEDKSDENIHRTKQLTTVKQYNDNKHLQSNKMRSRKPMSRMLPGITISKDLNVRSRSRLLKRDFCRLLCAYCSTKVSRRYSVLCYSECLTGGIAYNICLTVWDITRNNQ